MNPNLEVRSVDEEVRMIEVDGRPQIRGYAAVFDSPSQVMKTPSGREFREIVKPGAFSRALTEADVRGLFNHDPSMLLGRRTAGTLLLAEDDRGLVYTIDPPKEWPGPTVIEALTRRDMTGSSFSFATIEDDWGTGPDGMAIRELRSVHLFDVGPVTFPAYVEATAAYRSYDRFIEVESRQAQVFKPSPEQVARLLRLRLLQLS